MARPTADDALHAARRMWLADQRIDMGALAAHVDVSRATLYNWVGSRELLIAEVLWGIAETTIDEAAAAARGTGAAYVSDVVDRYFRALAAFDPIRRFVARDAEYALRVLTCSRTPFQARLIARMQALVEEQVARAGYVPPLDPPTLAYLLVRIGESFIFNDAITGTEPDLATAAQASRVLLSAPPA